jgi:hypothetical protein
MKKRIYSLIVIFNILFTFAACERDNFDIKYSGIRIKLNVPTGIQNPNLTEIILTFKESNTGIETIAMLDEMDKLDKVLPTGSYTVTLNGKIGYSRDNIRFVEKVKSYKDGIALTGQDQTISLDLFLANDNAGFIFKEIFFTGTQTPENKLYQGDKYFLIYNNSEDTLYADKLLISQSTFLTTTKREYTPNVMNEAFTTTDICMIPGNGMDYPIAPGHQLLIASNAIDHTESNPNSFDLKNADFEMQLLAAINVDNPEVTNTITISGSMTMHNRGFTSYVLARLPENVSVDDFKTEHYYTYSYLSGTRIVPANAYKIPNSYILDAVNLTVPTVFEWIVMSPQLDMGWSYAGKLDGDTNRFGKSVLRKELTTNPDGRVIYQDTNNSTVDFIPEATPSIKNK